MSGVKRYSSGIIRGQMDHHLDGEFVKYTDYAALEAENKRLREALDDIARWPHIHGADFAMSMCNKIMASARQAIAKEVKP